MTHQSNRTIGALIFPDFETLDLFGPLEMFGSLEEHFTIRLVAETLEPVRSRHGQLVTPDFSLSHDGDFDLILVPGGLGTPIETPNPAIDAWLVTQTQRAELVLSVCTGSGLLARNGLLDGRRATTNKLAFDRIRQHGPGVEWVRAARWVEDGKFITASGVSAGMDMALGVIERLVNGEAAQWVALVTEYTWHQDPNNDPFAVIPSPEN